MVLRFYPKIFLHVEILSSWFENKYQVKYIKVDSILISFDQVESVRGLCRLKKLLEESTHIVLASGVNK